MTNPTPRTVTVTPCDFWGTRGWAFEGWSGYTPREAVYEAALHGEGGISTDEAFSGDLLFIDGSTGEPILEDE